MALINVRDDERMSELYRAAWRGDAEALAQLLQPDASILANIPDCHQTPLHISALLGHVPFTRVLLYHVRDLAFREDSSRRTALHLASAEGHIHIVRELLQVNNQPFLGRDREGRVPLHYAAMRGRTEVVQELIMARPDSLSHVVDGEESTVFHLCVTYNHLNTLETLVKLDYATANITAGQPRPPIFTRPDSVGNTIIHLAIMSKRVEAVRYLLSIPEIRELGKKTNEEGLTALDILERSPKGWKIKEIKLVLTKYDKEESETSMVKRITMIFKGMRSSINTDWIEEVRGNLSAASIFMATITFQALINPPGSFIQQDLPKRDDAPSPSGALNCTSLGDKELCPGEAVSSFYFQRAFLSYAACITISFYASLSVTLLLLSGVPLQNIAAIWFLSIGMSLAVLSLAVAYNFAVYILVYSAGYLRPVAIVAFVLWTCGFVLPLVLFNTLHFLIWIADKCLNKINKKK